MCIDKQEIGLENIWSQQAVLDFFACSACLDHAVVRPLSHVHQNWELTWNSDKNEYEPEEDSFASHMNVLIQEIASSHPPDDYHSHENNLASLYPEVKNGRYKLGPSKKRWIDTSTNSPVPIDTLGHMIEQGSSNHDVPDLVLAAAGRVAGAIKNKKPHFDDQDSGHMEMLAVVMMTILFRRSDKPAK